ncbi:hypothetical protein GGI11_000268 [Coemansia sp. RSA 2049]|nr:hypothetical protein H4217_001853 [Coemansia sp. RSA 1939]KAJ2525138.1 hypothetical protein GGI11_000268 [Coemansia sp. RSA 2049]
MIRRKDTLAQDILPRIPISVTPAFAYRPYNVTAPEATHLDGAQSDWDNGEDSDDARDNKAPKTRIIGGSSGGSSSTAFAAIGNGGLSSSLEKKDRARMLQLYTTAITARIRDAKQLIDDAKFEYSCDVLYECQRGFNFLGKANFSSKLLHPMDPPPWCDTTMKLTLPNVHSFQLPDPSWQWVSPRWLIDMTLDVDDDGWQYSSRFSQSVWHGRHSATRSFVRRRRWLRLRRRPRVGASISSTAQTVDPVNGPGTSLVVVDVTSPGGGGIAESFVKRKRHRLKKNPILIANKFKNKVSGGYVGTCPKSPTKPAAKPLAYTLKNGKYRSHNLKAVDSYAVEVAAQVLTSCPPSPSIERTATAPASPVRKLGWTPSGIGFGGLGIGGGSGIMKRASSFSALAPPTQHPSSSSLLSPLQINRNRLPKISDGNIPGTRIPYSHISTIAAIAEESSSSGDDGDGGNVDRFKKPPIVPLVNIIGSSPISQEHSHQQQQQQQPEPIQQLKRCLSETWQKHEFRRTPTSSCLRLCIQRDDDSDNSDNEEADAANSIASTWGGGGGGGDGSSTENTISRLPLPTIIIDGGAGDNNGSSRNGSPLSMNVPKLTPLAPPEPTSPRSPASMKAVDDSLELVRRHEHIIARRLMEQKQQIKRRHHHTGGRSLLRIASFVGNSVSRKPSVSRTLKSARSMHSLNSLQSVLAASSSLNINDSGSSASDDGGDDDSPLPQPMQKKQKVPTSCVGEQEETGIAAERAGSSEHDEENEEEDDGLSIVTRKSSRSTAADSSSSDRSSTSGALEFYSGNGGRPQMSNYVNPYASIRAPDIQKHQEEAEAAKESMQPPPPPAAAHLDKSLIKMAGDSLRTMISEIPLDRERLEFLREGLTSGGITAATIWYSFPWLHLELMQFDASRQRLISMLLSYSHTCPADALRVFAPTLRPNASASENSTPSAAAESDTGANYYEQLFLDSLDARDREEYVQIVDSAGLVSELSPSQVWRFVIRPVVAHDSDLFYSDYKMMTMGIARWSMTTVPKRQRQAQHR